MNRRFVLPVSVAVAVHATLLFGFKRTTHTPEVKPPLVPTIETRFPLPPEEIEIVDASREPLTKGSPAAPRPDPEFVPSPLIPPLFPVNPTRPSPVRTDFKSVLSAGPIGHPDGTLESGPIISVSVLDNPPNARVRVPPDYPFAAKQSGLDGDVMVEFSVDEAGRVFNPMVLKSSDRIFEESTLRAVSKWRFEPGKRDGRPVKFRMAVPVVFRLSGS